MHLKEDRMWISFGTSFKTINCFNLFLQHDDSSYIELLDITEKYVKRLSRPSSPCRKYKTESGYNLCVEKTVEEILKSNLTCTYAGNLFKRPIVENYHNENPYLLFRNWSVFAIFGRDALLWNTRRSWRSRSSLHRIIPMEAFFTCCNKLSNALWKNSI